MIKYQFAKDIDGNVIDINQIDNINKKNAYFCIGCDETLIKKTGKKRVRHFAHKNISCSKETYLHSLGKQLFYNRFIECSQKKQPFYIELNQAKICNHYERLIQFSCFLGFQRYKVDLTDYFDEIYFETKEGNFTPDLLLSNSKTNQKIFIEIAVTHKSSISKLSSKYRIIELQADNEDDFKIINKCFLSDENTKVTFIGFKNLKSIKSWCNGECEKFYSFLTIYGNGEVLLRDGSLKEIYKILSDEKTSIVKQKILPNAEIGIDCIYEKDYYIGQLKLFIAESFKEKIKVIDCYLCRYHGLNKRWDSKPIFCKFLKFKCFSNNAINCKFYKIECSYVNDYLENY